MSGERDGRAAPRARRGTTLGNIQALRGVAALIVVCAHVSGPDGFETRVFGSAWTSWSNLPANTGVDLFFVISGLIMVVTTWRAFDEPGSSRRFLYRRITRIYPLYWIVNTAILLLFVLSPASVSFDDGSQPDILGSYLLLPHDGRLPVLVAWSLVYEMYFYLLFTLALTMRRRRFGWVMAAWTGVTLVLFLTLGQSSNPYLSLISSPLSLEFVFGVGIGYAVLRGWLFRPRTVLAVGIVAAVGVLVLLGASGWEQFPSDMFRVLGPGVAAALLVYGAVGVEVRHGGTFPAPMQRLGDCSYSLYLIHVPALTLLAAVLARVLPTGPLAHAFTLVAVPVYVVVGAYLCYRILERPLQEFFRRSLARRTPAPAADAPALRVDATPLTELGGGGTAPATRDSRLRRWLTGS